MAEFTMQQAAQLQYRLAVEFRVSLIQLDMMTATQLYNLFDALKNEPEKELIRGIRQTFPVIMKDQSLASNVLASSLFNQSRELYGMTKGASKAVNNRFISSPQDFINSGGIQTAINKRMDEAGYHFGQMVNTGRPPQEFRTTLVQIAQRGPLDVAYESVKFDMQKDEAAKEEPKRIANPQGCPFCKHMAVFVGMEDNPNFHKGCSCTSQPAWAYETEYRPDWADAHEDAYYKRRDEIRENNAREWTQKQRRVQQTRVKKTTGETVTEWKTEKYWVDKDGKEGKPESTSIKHIIATMPRG